MKRCTHCKERKQEGDFNRRSSARDGLTSWCRDCLTEVHKRWRKTAKGKESMKRYWQSEGGKATRKRYLDSQHTQGSGLDRWVEKIAREVEE